MKHTLAALAATALTAQGATTVHQLGGFVPSGGYNPTSHPTIDVITPWSAAGSAVVTNGQIYSGIAGTVDGIAFTYDITFDWAGSTSSVNIFNTGTTEIISEGTAGSSRFNGGEGFDVTISNISVPTVVFDGFINAMITGASAAEGWNLSGTNYTANTNGDNGHVDGIVTVLNAPFTPIATDGSLEARAIGTVRFGSTQFQFSSVPEPSAAALLGLGGLALILRRRK